VPAGLGPDPTDLSKNGDFARGTEERGKAITALLQQLNEGPQIAERNADAIARIGLQLQVATGQMSRYDAAQATAALHAQEYVDAMAQLDKAAGGVAANPALSEVERRGQLEAITNRRSTVTGAYMVTQAEDNAAKQTAMALGALREEIDKTATQFSDLGAHLASLFSSTVGGFNSTFAGAVMAHSANGQEYRKNMENAFAGQFRSTGQRGLESALQLGEGTLMKKFGFGGKADGSQASPYWVRMADGMLSANTITGAVPNLVSAGSALSTSKSPLTSLISLLPLMHFAAGGDISSNMPAIVGENGPELFMPTSSGRVVPNDELGGGSGGDLHLHIDARGATDPAAVSHQIRMAVNGLRQEVPAIAIAAHRHYNRQRPGSSRI
jgi:hypothetical protein